MFVEDRRHKKCRPSAGKSRLTLPGGCQEWQGHKTAWNQLKVYVLWHRERNPRPKGRLILRTKNVKECVESICFWTQRTQKRGHQEHRQPKVWTVGRKIASAASGPCPAAKFPPTSLPQAKFPPATSPTAKVPAGKPPASEVPAGKVPDGQSSHTPAESQPQPTGSSNDKWGRH